MSSKERRRAIETGMVFRNGRYVPVNAVEPHVRYSSWAHNQESKPRGRVFLCAYCFKDGGELINFGDPDPESGVQIKGHEKCQAAWNALGSVGQHAHIKMELIRRGLVKEEK